jgi:tetratricopeptide (TPR) repeat protein
MKYVITLLALSLSLTVLAQKKTSYLDAGYLKLKKNQYGAARELYTKAIAQDSIEAQPYFARSLASLGLKDFPAAIADLKKSIDLQPDFIPALDKLAQVYLQLDEYAKLRDLITETMKTTVTEYNNYYYLGKAYLELEEYDKALLQFDTHIEGHANDANAWLDQGTALIYLERYPEAIKSLTHCLSITPKDVEALIWRGIAKSNNSDLLGALEDLNRVEAMFPDYVPVYEIRGDLKITMADSLGARADFDKGLKLSKEPNYALMMKRGLLALNQFEDLEDALTQFEKIVALAGDSMPRALYYKAYIEGKKGLYNLADTDYQKYHQLDSANTDMYQFWARMKLNQKDYDKAIEYGKIFLSADSIPTRAAFWGYYIMGQAQYAKQDYIGALYNLTKATDCTTEHGYAHLWLAKTFIALHRDDELCAELLKAYTLGVNEAKDLLIEHCHFTEEFFQTDDETSEEVEYDDSVIG